MKTYGEVDEELHAFLTSTLSDGECFTSEKGVSVHWTGGGHIKRVAGFGWGGVEGRAFEEQLTAPHLLASYADLRVVP
jgi:hypothetical protein